MRNALNPSLMVVLVSMLILLTQYQNCAPPSQYDESLNEGAPPISTIDDVNLSTNVQILEKDLVISESAESFSLNGLCFKEQSGAILKWTLSDPEGAVIDEGHVRCDLGGFHLEVLAGDDLHCDKSYTVSVQLGVGEQGSATISRDCYGDFGDDASSSL